MKKILSLGLALLLTLSLLTACVGSGTSNGNGNDGPKATRDVISVSALISLEDARVIMGQEMEISSTKPTPMPFSDTIRYISEAHVLRVDLLQEALYDENKPVEQRAMTKGWAAYLESEQKRLIKLMEEGHENFTISSVAGVGNAAYLEESKLDDFWALWIFYEEYIITVAVSQGSLLADDASESEIAWYNEKLMEAGKLAVEHLKAIIG